jgi:aspartyl protease family protein
MEPAPAEQQRRLGLAMSLVAWLAVLGLLIAFFSSWSERQHNPNQSVATRQGGDGVREIELRRNRAGHYVASGTINGAPVVFMVDTGASDIAVPEDLATRLGLPIGMQQIYNTANGAIMAHNTRLASVALGGIELTDVAASINPGMQGDQVLLGMSFLKHLEFTQRGDTLTVRQGVVP